MVRRACVVVLGELGHSPRTLNHAISLSKHMNVQLVGYSPAPDLREERISISTLTPYPPALPHKLPSILNYLLKTIWQTINLLMVLLMNERCDVLLCQNPPAIPSLFVCWLYCMITKAKFIIDWHNYAHSIMAMSCKRESLIVKASTRIEYYFGRKANANFCVSQAMKNDLLENYNIQCKLLYDCPPECFKPINDDERNRFFLKMSRTYPEFIPTIRKRGILFSSTSWTMDEDFMILLNALEDYDKTAIGDQRYPEILCVITGKGPMKDFYIKLIETRDLRRVTFITPWLEQADYPLMVASADLGVCLHTSSSGLDLPMKIVDMFGSGLPVCAYKYPCLRELVKEDENGYMFEDSKELAFLVKQWFYDFPNNKCQNDVAAKFKTNLKAYQDLRWNNNWENRAKPYFM